MQLIDFVAGLTIQEAIERGIKKSKELKEPVAVDINDIILILDEKTNINKAIAEYRSKSKFKFEIEKMRREHQNEK